MFLVLLFALAGGFEMRAKLFDGNGENIYAGILRGNRAHDGRVPAITRHDKGKHGMELLFQAVRSFAVSFIEHKDVRDFHKAGFHALNVVTEAWNHNDDNAVGEANNIHFVLANTNGFDEDLFFAGGVEDERDFGSGARKAAKKTARCRGANENYEVARVALHANAVTEDRTARVWTRRVNSDDADFLIGFAIVGRETIHQGAFSSAWCSCDAGKISTACVGKQTFQKQFGFGRMIFNGSDSAGDGENFAGTDLLRPVFNCSGHDFPEGSGQAREACFYYLRFFAEKLARDDKFLNFAGALPDGTELDVAVKLFGRIVLDEAVATVNLHAFVCNANGNLAGKKFGHARFAGEASGFLIGEPCGLIHKQACGFDFRRHVRELELNCLEFADGLAELLPLLGVIRGGVERA